MEVNIFSMTGADGLLALVALKCLRVVSPCYFNTMVGVMCSSLHLALWGEPPARALTVQVFTTQLSADKAKHHAQVKTFGLSQFK